MNEIIKIKPEWESICRRHTSKVDDLQRVVNELVDVGLKVAFGDVQDLLNNGTALYEQAEQAAKSNASIFTLPAAKRKFIDENTQLLQDCILKSKKELTRILALEQLNPLSIEAFEIGKGVVSISATWIEKLKESHTIQTSESREKALELMGNVEAAIQELNDFVKDNKYFYKGFSTPNERRSLLTVSQNNEIIRNIDDLEFI